MTTLFYFVVIDTLKFSDEDRCATCQNALGKIKQEMSDPKLQVMVENATEELCYEFIKFPSKFQKLCKQFLDQYFNSLISYVVKEIDSSIVSE